jgi:hypothetical protein
MNKMPIGYPKKLYADLILANLGEPERKGNIKVIEPKLLVGMAHLIARTSGGAKSWEQLKAQATVVCPADYSNSKREELKDEYISEFRKILSKQPIRDVSDLFSTLFCKAGVRNRKKSGLVVEPGPRKINRKSILNTQVAYLDAIYVRFGQDSYQVVSYCPFSINDKETGFSSGAAYFVKVNNWQNAQKALDSIVNMLIEENNA